ncbi:MAG: hypothetical protein ACHQZQ_06325 [SAR324 cluster bacterium]
MDMQNAQIGGIGVVGPLAPYDVVRERLQQVRLNILTEIQHYPTPIPHCDQQFNWLLEQRDRVSAELQTLDELRERAAAELQEFVRKSPFLAGDAGLRDTLSC